MPRQRDVGVLNGGLMSRILRLLIEALDRRAAR
jgi:hypothetical protein